MSRKGSSEKINYLIRPAKQVERKLIIEALLCLKKEYSIQKYQYIGMGSLYFVDYQLIHKYLGINKMISMEMEEDNIARFEFNKPYRFIDIIAGLSTKVLPLLDWKKNNLVWLDYDNKVSPAMIDDIQIVCNYVKRGGILIITIDGEPKRFEQGEADNSATNGGDRIYNFKKAMHPHYPEDIKKTDIQKKRFPYLLRRIIDDALKDNLSRNSLNYYQIFNFVYEDTSQMYTYGCLFDEKSDKLKKCEIFELGYISKDERMVEINLPIITPREKIDFDRQIPGIDKKMQHLMNPNKLKNYEGYYKYYPQYFEALL